jgi:hypothetical protein
VKTRQRPSRCNNLCSTQFHKKRYISYFASLIIILSNQVETLIFHELIRTGLLDNLQVTDTVHFSCVRLETSFFAKTIACHGTESEQTLLCCSASVGRVVNNSTSVWDNNFTQRVGPPLALQKTCQMLRNGTIRRFLFLKRNHTSYIVLYSLQNSYLNMHRWHIIEVQLA